MTALIDGNTSFRIEELNEIIQKADNAETRRAAERAMDELIDEMWEDQ